MIPQRYAELLDLPPETELGEAQRHCQQLLEKLRRDIHKFPPTHPSWPRLDRRHLELEEVNRELGALIRTASETPTRPAPDPVFSEPLSGYFRKALDLDEHATPAQALAKAEARLKEISDAQNALKPKHPAHPRLRCDRERFDRLVAELREAVFGGSVNEFCVRAEQALDRQPPDQAEADDYLRRARLAGRQLPPKSLCLRRVQKLEERLQVKAAEPVVVQPAIQPDLPASAPVAAMPPVPTPPPPENLFLRMEDLLDKGMACLTRDAPDQAAARDFLGEAEREAVGKTVPENIAGRMRLFKQALEHLRREAIHRQIDELFKQATAALTLEPPRIAEGRENMKLAAALLRQAPDDYLQRELDGYERAIQEHEEWWARRSIELAVAEQTIETPQPEPAPPVAQLSPAPEPSIGVRPSPPAIPVTSSSAPAQPIQNPISESGELPVVGRPRRGRASGWLVALLILGLIGVAYAGFWIFNSWPKLRESIFQNHHVAKPPVPAVVVQQDSGELSLSVTPSDAEVFTNGVSLGRPGRPVQLRGLSGQEITLAASLAGYSNVNKSVVIPEPGSPASETLELQPKPALLIVHSEPAATEVVLHPERAKALMARRSDEGIELTPGVPVEVALEVPDYEAVTMKLPALKPGEQRMVDFGSLKLLPATLHPKAEPADAQFSIAYPGHDPIPYGPTTTIEGVQPRVTFQLIAERQGYGSETNSFLLNPREVRDFNFGKLKPLSATLTVTAPLPAFNLKVAWDGASKDYGADGRAAGLPPGKNLLITVSAAGREPATTNLVMAPGEKRELYFGGLQPAKGYLLLKSEPPGAEVTYSIDGHFPTFVGATNRLDGLPLGHNIEVTLRKPGYQDQSMTRPLLLSGDAFDFGHLTPVAAPVGNSGTEPKVVYPVKPAIQVNKYSASNIEKLLKEIEAHIAAVRSKAPLSENSRREWNEWINTVESMYRNNGLIWNRVQVPLSNLRESVNTTLPIQRVPLANGSP